MTKEVLTAFSPSSDFLAVATTDGRIKTWDVGSGHLRGEFVDVAASTSGAGTAIDDGSGHLAVDYSCITWVSLPTSSKKARKKGNKNGQSLLLVLGTAAGDVLAWDASLGQLKWRANDCNAGGVKALGKSKCGKILYAAGADGIICEIDSGSGQVLEKFRAAKTAISCVAVSPDGGSVLTASSELKLFDLSSKKRIRKFTGHPAEVTALAFSQDGKYALSSSTGERQVSIWECEANTSTTGAALSLSCDQSVVSLDGTRFQEGTGSLKLLAVSEGGVAYVWQATTLKELAGVKPTTVSVAKSPGASNGVEACIIAAILARGGSEEVTTVQVAHGTIAKPAFEQVHVSAMGTSLVLGSDASGALLPSSHQMETDTVNKTNVTVLGPENAADAVISKAHLEFDDISLSRNVKKRSASIDFDDDEVPQAENLEDEETAVTMDEDDEQTMEERLISLGIVDKEVANGDKPEAVVKVVPPRGDSLRVLLSQALQSDDSSMLERCLSVQDEKLIKNTVSKLRPSEASKFLSVCMLRLETRPRRGLALVSWLRAVLLQHSASLMTNPSMQPVLTTLYQLIEARMTVFRPLLALSGRLDLITAQILGQEAGLVEEVEEVVEAVVYEEGDSEIEVEEVEEGEEAEESGSSGSDANETMVSDSEGEEDAGTQ
ncbi:hypothetical protein Mapa_002563 [Marchantia paleacea]|nr:hypothetical protein Mapa_002563 [Marchantia paleacea]